MGLEILRAFVRVFDAEEPVVEAHFGGKGVRSFHPVDRPFDFAMGLHLTAFGLGIVGAAQLDDLPVFIFDDLFALDNVAVAQPHFASGGQAVESPRRVLHEVVAFDVEHAGKGNLARSFFRDVVRLRYSYIIKCEEAHFDREGMRGFHPVNGSFDLAMGLGSAAFGLGIVGAAQLDDLPVFVFDDFFALDDVAVAQPHFASGSQAVEAA